MAVVRYDVMVDGLVLTWTKLAQLVRAPGLPSIEGPARTIPFQFDVAQALTPERAGALQEWLRARRIQTDVVESG